MKLNILFLFKLQIPEDSSIKPDEPEDEPELPPPMKPVSVQPSDTKNIENSLSVLTINHTVDEIEKIVKDTTVSLRKQKKKFKSNFFLFNFFIFIF